MRGQIVKRMMVWMMIAAMFVSSNGLQVYAATVTPNRETLDQVDKEENSTEEFLPQQESTEETTEETVEETTTEEPTTEESTTEEPTTEEPTTEELPEATLLADETATELDTVTLSTSTQAAIREALTNASSSVDTSVSDTVVYTLKSNLILNAQINLSKIGYSNVVLLADQNITIKRGNSFTGSNLFYLKGQTLTIGSKDGMSGSITIDGGAETTETLSGYSYKNIYPQTAVYENTGLTAKKGLLYLDTGSTATIYGGVKLCNNAAYRAYENTADFFSNACVIGNYQASLTLDGCEITNCGFLPTSDSDFCMPLISNTGTSATLTVNDVNIHDNYVTGIKWQHVDLSDDRNFLYGKFKGSGIITNNAGTVTISGGQITDAVNRDSDNVDATVAILNAGTLTIDGNVTIGNNVTADEYGNVDYVGKGYQFGVINSCGAFGTGKNYATSTQVSFEMNGGTIHPGVLNHGKFVMNGGTLGIHYQTEDGSSLDNCCGFTVSNNCYNEYNTWAEVRGGTITGTVYNEGYYKMSGGILNNEEQDSQYGIESWPANMTDKWKPKTELTGGTICNYETGVHAYGLGSVLIAENAVIEKNYYRGVEIEPFKTYQLYDDEVYDPEDLNVVMTGGEIRNNGQVIRNTASGVGIVGFGGRFILEGGKITGNRGETGCALFYDDDKQTEPENIYPYIIIRGGKVSENYSQNGYVKEYYNSKNYAPVKDGSVYLSKDVMVLEGVTISDVFSQNYAYRDPDNLKETVSVGSYEELCANFTVSENAGVKTLTLDKNICITGMIEIPTDEKVNLEAGTEIIVTRDKEYSSDLFCVKQGAELTINQTSDKTILMDGEQSFGVKAINGSLFYVEDGASLVLSAGVKILDQVYESCESNENAHGSILTNYGSSSLNGVTIQNNVIHQNTAETVAMVHNLGGTLSLTNSTISDCENAIKISAGSVTLSQKAVIEYLDGIGVLVDGTGHFILDGGEIENCGIISITDGAAVKMLSDHAKFTLTSGTISSNEAKMGSAIYRLGKGTVTIQGGSVTENYATQESDNNHSGVTDGSFYADCADNIIWEGVTKDDVFTLNHADILPPRFGGSATVTSRSDFDKYYPVSVLNGKNVRFVHDTISLQCEITVKNEEIWIPLNDTTIVKAAACGNLIRVTSGGNLTLGAPDISDKKLTIDGAGIWNPYSQGNPTRPMIYGRSAYLNADCTLIYNEENAVTTIRDGVTLQNAITETDNTAANITVGSAVTNYGTFNLYGATITKNGTTYHKDDTKFLMINHKRGYVPCILNKGTDAVMNIDGAVIEKNATGGAAILENAGGSIIMTDATITAYEQDGGFQTCVNNTGDFIMKNGSIEQTAYNTAFWYDNCGSVFNNKGTVTQEGGLISGSLSNLSGDKSLENCFTMTGGIIEGFNRDTVTNDGKATISGGEIVFYILRKYEAILPNANENCAIFNKNELTMTGGKLYFDYNKNNLSDLRDHPERFPNAIHNTGNASISNCTIEKFNRGIINKGSLTLTDCVLDENYVGLKLAENEYEDCPDITATISGETRIQYNIYAGVEIVNQGTVTMNSGRITNNGSGKNEQGGVRMTGSKAKFVLNDGRISGNYGLKGAAVYAKDNAVFELNGGVITKNYNESGTWGKTLPAGLSDISVYMDGGKIIVKDGLKAENLIYENYGGMPITASIVSMKYYLYLAPGQSESLEVKIKGDDELDYEIVSGEDVISVDETGVVTALQPGQASIYVKCRGSRIAAYSNVEVQDLFLEPEQLDLERDEEKQLTLMERKIVNGEEVIVPATVNATFSSANADIASVKKDAKGNVLVTGEGKGSTEIRATIIKKSGNRSAQMTCKVPVNVTLSVREVSLNKKQITLEKDDMETLRAYISPFDTDEDYTIYWECSNPSVASIEPGSTDNSVSIIGLSEGNTIITAILSVNEEERSRAACEVFVPKTMSTLEPIYVLTNTCTTLADVPLPKNYTWKEGYTGETAKTKLVPSEKPQEFEAVYYDAETKEYGNAVITLCIGTLTGIKVSGDTLLECDDMTERTLTVAPVFKGMQVPLEKENFVLPYTAKDGFFTFEETDTAGVFKIYAQEDAYGKGTPIIFRIKLDGADVKKSAQKGKLWFETKVNAKVAAKGKSYAENITLDMEAIQESLTTGIKLEDNGESVYTLTVDEKLAEQKEIALPLIVRNRKNEEITESVGISWSSKAKNVATVSAKGVVTIKKAGTTVITAKANDGTEKAVTVYLQVKNYQPRMTESTLSLNLASKEGVTGRIYAEDGSTLEDGALSLSMYNKSTKQYEDASPYFTIEQNAENPCEFTIRATDRVSVAQGKSQTYALFLDSAITAGGVTRNYNNGKGIKFSLKVSNALPKVTYKQGNALNLFYKDTEETMYLTCGEAIIKNVVWKTGEEADFAFKDFREGMQATATVYQITDTADVKNIDKKGVLLVTLEGYDKPVEVSCTIKTSYQKPVLRAKNGVINLWTEKGVVKGNDYILDKKSGEPFVLEDTMKLSADNGYTIEKCEDIENGFDLLAPENPKSSVKITIEDDNWREGISITEKVKNGETKATLTKSSFTLSNTLDLSMCNMMQTQVTIPMEVQQITVSSIQPADKNTKAVLASSLLVVRTDGDKISLGLQKRNNKLAKGTYKILVTPQIIPTEDAEAVALKPVTLTIKVVDKKPAVTLKGNTNFFATDREADGAKTYIPSVQNTSAAILSVKPDGSSSSKFTMFLDEQGNVKITPKKNITFSSNRTYSVVPVFTMEDGSTVIGNSLSLRPYQPSVKFKADVNNITMYRGATGILNGTKVKIENPDTDKIITDITCLTEGFSYNPETEILYIDNPYALAGSTSAKVTLKVDLEGQAADSKYNQVVVNVKIQD